MSQLSLYLQVIFYVFAGINHFRMERFYLKMMPDYLPWHKQIVFWTGIAEIALGIGLLFSPIRNIAAWGIILLLLAIFPANIDMILSQKFNKIPKWILWIRLPFQVILILWAYSFT
ncbi:MAG: DoxX family protein [Bacteroidota bacterium]